MKRTRTPSNPRILKAAPPGVPAKPCRDCKRNMALCDYDVNTSSKDGFYPRCKDCKYIRDCVKRIGYAQVGPPLKVARYREEMRGNVLLRYREVA